MKRKGFTLIELLVVIAIIGLLSTLAVVSLNNAREKARDARRKSDLNQIMSAMEMYITSNDDYPIDTGACGSAGCIASGSYLCAGVSLTDSDGSVYLQSIMADPSTESGYDYSGSADGYCISALLEAPTVTTYFKCQDGYCEETTGGDCS